MTRFITILIFTFCCEFIYCQPKCDCPNNDYVRTSGRLGKTTDTIFNLKKNNKIILCGFKNVEGTPLSYSEFVLAVCGQKNIIDFWDATQTCFLKINNDTLLVESLLNLPTGKNRNYEQTKWSTEKIYFKGKKVLRVYLINTKIASYSNSEIAKTLEEYETAKGDLNDAKMELANRLFIATLSGNKKARKYFESFETKFGRLDGAFLEEYRNLTSMLVLWNRQQGSS